MKGTLCALGAILLTLVGTYLWIMADCTLTPLIKTCLSAAALLAIAYVFSPDREAQK